MRRPGVLFFLATFLAAVSASAGDVVVLQGGQRIELKGAWVQQGDNALLTRSDGALLSVPISEIDLKATAEARKTAGRVGALPAVAASAQTPAEAARIGRVGPKAKVRLTDADVSHEGMPTAAEATGAGEKRETVKGAARLDVAGYDQAKAGPNLIVRGSLRNFGGTTASNARMSISAMDEKGELIGTGEASLSKGNLDPFETVAFTAAIPVGDKIVGGLRFRPQWMAAPPPATPAEAAAAAAQRPAAVAAGPAAQANQPPAPQPTPYGQGVLYAPPAPSASMTPPADGRTGYIPGASDPASQPKPPNQ